MAEFKINIIEPEAVPVEYTPHVGYKKLESCTPFTEQTYTVQLINPLSSEYSILDSYTGSPWKYLYINGMVPNLQIEFCECMGMAYGGTGIPLPVKIDIEGLSGSNIIPTLEVVIGDYELMESEYMKAFTLSFYIEDIYGEKGEEQQASFQALISKCSTDPVRTPVISSSLSYITDMEDPDSYIFEYYIESIYPTTSYGASGLPSGSDFNSETGYIRINAFVAGDRHTDVTLYFDISAINSEATPTTDTKTFTMTITPFRGYL